MILTFIATMVLTVNYFSSITFYWFACVCRTDLTPFDLFCDDTLEVYFNRPNTNSERTELCFYCD